MPTGIDPHHLITAGVIPTPVIEFKNEGGNDEPGRLYERLDFLTIPTITIASPARIGIWPSSSTSPLSSRRRSGKMGVPGFPSRW